MINLAQGDFPHVQVEAALHAANRKIGFRYELLDAKDRFKKDLHNILSAEVSFSSLAQIKRTGRFTMKEDEAIDFLNDRIKPYMRLFIPPGRILARQYGFFSQNQPVLFKTLQTSTLTGWVEFPLGVFLMSSPTRKDDGASVVREIEAYDGLLVLRDDKFLERYTILEGTSYYDAVVAILTSAGITRYNLDFTENTLKRSIEFEPGKEKLFAINELLGQINYTPIHVDVNGYYTSREYRSPEQRSVDYVYKTDNKSVILQGAEEELDLFSVYNAWTVVRTNEEQEPLVSSFVNEDPANPTSTVSRGRIIPDYREIENIADQAALDAYVQRIAFEASQVYGRIRFDTALMPFHDYSNVLQLEYEPLGIKGKYSELSWSMPLAVGGEMTHELRQIINVGGGSS